jgi:hypothetical protein
MSPDNLRSTIAPNLPVATLEYSNIYTDQFANVLRLYFNQLDNANTQEINSINNLNVTSWLSLGTGIW